MKHRFHLASELLGVPVDADPSELKRAYRRAVARFPPDQAPREFQKVREAYELLLHPIERAFAVLSEPVPWVDPPRGALPQVDAKEEGDERAEPLGVVYLRALVSTLDARQLMGSEKETTS